MGLLQKKTFLFLGDGYEAVYNTLIENGILKAIDDKSAELAIPKEELGGRLSPLLGDRLSHLTSDQKKRVLSILKPSTSDPETSFLRFHREPKINKSQAFKMHILVDFMMGVEKTDQWFDRQQVLDLSLVKEQNGQLKLLLFSNLDSPLLSNLCGIISDQYGIPVEYPQLDPKNYDLDNKKKSISVDSNSQLDGGASVKILDKREKDRLHKRYREAGRTDVPEEGALHAEQRAQQYINAYLVHHINAYLVHHVNTQTSFCDENVLMRHTHTIPVLKPLQQDWVLPEDLSSLVDTLIKQRLGSPGKKSGSGDISGREVVEKIVKSFFDNGSDLNIEVLNQTIREANSLSQHDKVFNVANVERILGEYLSKLKGGKDKITSEDEPKPKIITLLENWKGFLQRVSPERIINDQLSHQNARDKTTGSCQCCRSALRGRRVSSGSFIQDVPGEIPVKFAESNGVFKLVLDKMLQNKFLEIEQSERKTFVFTKQYADMALGAKSRESFIASLAKDLIVDNKVLTNFFELEFFTHLRGTEVPWPLPKGRQGRTLPLDHDTIIDTAMLDENSNQLDLKTLLEKRSALNQTGDLKILDTRDAESKDVGQTLAHRLGASLLNQGESDGNNPDQLDYVLNYGVEPSTYKVSLQYKRDGNLGISEIARVGAHGTLEIVFPAPSPSDREG